MKSQTLVFCTWALLTACSQKQVSAPMDTQSTLSPISAIRPEAACWSQPQVPKLYQYYGSITADDESSDHFVAGFQDQNCEEKLVYLDACDLAAAKSLLGFVTSRPEELSFDAWDSMITPETGSYYALPHLSCAAGSRVQVEKEPDQNVEAHVIPGWTGYTSVSVKQKMKDGASTRLHYVADYACLKIRKNLDAAAYIDPSDSNVADPLILAGNDEAILLTCGREIARTKPRGGWNLFPSTDGDLFIARFYAEELTTAPELVIRAVNGYLIRRMGDEEKSQAFADVASRLNVPGDAGASVIWNGDKKQLLFDLCTLDDCSQFQPLHARWVPDRRQSVGLDKKEWVLKTLVQRDNETLDYLPMEGDSRTRLMSFESCSRSTDLTALLGFTRTPGPTDWLKRAEEAGKLEAISELVRIPCRNKKPACLITVDSERYPNLSMTSSSLYKGLSTLMRRPELGACATAQDLEIRIKGHVSIENESLVLGNLESSIQNPFETIRLTGDADSVIELKRSCTDCSGSLLPAVELRGNAKFLVDTVQFETADDPIESPSVALAYRGGDLGTLAIRNVAIGQSSEKNKAFTIGLALNKGTVNLWNIQAKAHYIAVDASAEKLAIFGMTEKKGANETLLGTTVLEVMGSSASPGLPTTDLGTLESIRTLRVEDSQVYLRGVEFHGPFGLDMGGQKAASYVSGISNKFRNPAKAFGNRSSAFYVRGAASASLDWSDVQDIGGLVEFGNLSAPNLSTVTFRSFAGNSWVARDKKIIWNASQGTVTNFSENCPVSSWNPELGTKGGCEL
jgi:hypothetical protein